MGLTSVSGDGLTRTARSVGLVVNLALAELTALVCSLGGYLLVPGQRTWSNEAGTVSAVVDGVIARIDSLGATAIAAQSTTAACPILRGKVTNLLLQSEAFSTSTYLKARVTVSAQNIISTTPVTDSHYTYQALQMPAGIVSFALDVTYVNHRWISLRLYDGVNQRFASFDIQSGVVGSVTSGAAASIKALGGNKYRLVISAAFPGSPGNVSIALNNADYAGYSYWTALGTEQVQLQQAMFVQGTYTAENFPPYVPTTTAPASLNSAPYWAGFDGIDDHLITGIPTPSTGYICVVGRQDEALGSVNALIGGYTTTQAGCSLDISATGYPRLNRAKADGTTDVCESTGVISVGVPFIIDTSWTASSAEVRLNGAAEGTSGVTKDPAGLQIMTLGARNAHATVGSITPAELFGGNEGAVIVIPNVTLPAAAEQRIRQLAAQIYGVPGVL